MPLHLVPSGLLRSPHLRAITVSPCLCLVSVDVSGVFAGVRVQCLCGACESADPIKNGQPAAWRTALSSQEPS